MKKPFNKSAPKLINATNAAARVNIRIPLYVSADLWCQLTGERTAQPDDPRLSALAIQLKNSISETFDGRSRFGCLESGVDFIAELGAAAMPAFASLHQKAGKPCIFLQTSDEVFADLRRRLAAQCLA